jgi:hypothetical protein
LTKKNRLKRSGTVAARNLVKQMRAPEVKTMEWYRQAGRELVAR